MLEAAGEGLDRLIAASIEPITRLQSWVTEESVFFLTAFQASYLEALFHAGASTLVGLLPSPWGPLYGFVYSALSGLWSAEQHNQLAGAMEEAVANSRLLNRAQNATTDAVLRYFMEDQASHVRVIAQNEGALRHIFRPEGGHYSDVRRSIELARRHLDGATASDNGPAAADREYAALFYSQASALFDSVHEYIDGLAAGVVDLGRAAARAPQVGERAIRDLLDQYTTFRASGPVHLHGRVRGPTERSPDDELSVDLRAFRFGEAREISSNLREHLMTKSVSDLAELSIPVAATLWVSSQSFSTNPRYRSGGGVWREPLHLWHGSDRAYSPRRPDGEDPRLVTALAALIDPELAAINLQDPEAGITAEERVRREMRSAQVALNRLWNLLILEPLSSRWSG